MTRKQLNTLVLKRSLVVAILVIVVLHVLMAVLDHYINSETLSYMRSLFDLDSEANVPTIFTMGMLLASSYKLLPLIRKKSKPANAALYKLLSLFFLFLAFDEFLSLHERTAEPVRNLFSLSQDNLLYHAWVIPAALVVVGFAAVGWFVARGKDADSRFQRKLMLIFIAGACGVFALEVIGTQLLFESLTAYSLGPVLVEELIEISTVSIILYTIAKKTHNMR